MSESQEHKKRLNQRLEFVAAFEKWVDSEPSALRFRKHRQWKQQRPVRKRDDE